MERGVPQQKMLIRWDVFCKGIKLYSSVYLQALVFKLSFGIVWCQSKAANLELKKSFSPVNLYPSTLIKHISVWMPWARGHKLETVSATRRFLCWGVPTEIPRLCCLVLEALQRMPAVLPKLVCRLWLGKSTSWHS